MTHAHVILEPRLSTQVQVIARRSITRTLRQPASLFPSIMMPMILLAVGAAGLRAAVRIPGFPTDSYLAFALAVPFMQVALFATINAGGALAEDIERGFLNRLALTPMRGAALILGQLAGAVMVAMIASLIFLVTGLALGVRFEAGLGGVVVLLLLAACIAMAFAAVGAFLALRTGSGEAIQGFFPVMFVFFFLSSINLPRDLITADWFRAVASANPVSYMVEGMRGLIIIGWDPASLVPGFAIALGMTAIALWGSSRALRTRLVRT